MTQLVQRLLKLLRERIYALVFGLVLVAAISAIVSMAAVANFPALTQADRYVQDWEIAYLLSPEPQDKDIVVVAVNEETLQQFPYRSPVDRAFIANLLTTLAARHPRAIGVDFLFDQPTEPAKDALLRKTLASLPVPLVVAYLPAAAPANARILQTHSDSVVDAQQAGYLNSFVPPHTRAAVNLALDQFGTVRWIYPGAPQKDGKYLMSFPRAVAAAAGVLSPPRMVPLVWHGKPSRNEPAFAEYPAHVAAFLPAQWFKNKIVLVGSDMTLVDQHKTPFTVRNGETMAGVVVQANAVAQLVHHTPSPFVSWRVDLLIAFLCAALGGILGLLNYPLLPRLLGTLALVVVLWAAGATLFHYGDRTIGLVSPTLALLICFSVMDSLTGREARKQRHFIQNAFSHYVSPKVVEKLIADPSAMALEGERREMTYLFSDIENFTTFSEQMDSKELARILNAYFDGVTEVVLRYGGMVDKFIGDAVFAIFNAPVDLPDHAERAVKCALEMDQWAQDYRAELRARGFNWGATRIGVHTGPAVIGNFGSRNRFNYTAQGDAVNAASRLEGLNKQFGTRICVSGATRALCKTIAFRPIASVVLKGKTAALEVFEPLRDGEKAQGFLERYQLAFAKLEEGSPEAASLFDDLAREAPDDPCVALHAGRLRRGAQGVAMVMAEK